MNPVSYAEAHFDEFIEKLKTLVRIPSISFPGFPAEEVKRSAKAVASHLKETGLENIEILEIEGAHPYVYADHLHAPGKPTLLLYAHHDVQPPGKEELWLTKPFEPVEKDGRLYGRGSADDKAGLIVHTSAIASYLRTVKSLPVNVKFLVEGEEEIGSGHLEEFLKKFKSRLQADVIVLTDTGNFDVGIPTITSSLRGLVAMEVEVSVMKQSVHSGSWGGPIPDPAIALAKMLGALVDEQGEIAIPGMYDKIRPQTKVEEDSIKALNYTNEELKKQVGLIDGVQIVGGDASPLKKITRLPSIAVNAMEANSRKNKANVVNASAWAKVGIRIVPDMDPFEVEKMLKDFLKAQAPWGVKVEITTEAAAGWWLTVPEGPAFEKAKAAFSKSFGRECVFLGCGGSIPFVAPFAEVLGGAPALLIGVEDPYTNAHSENESVHLGDLKKEIIGAIYFYESMAQD